MRPTRRAVAPMLNRMSRAGATAALARAQGTTSQLGVRRADSDDKPKSDDDDKDKDLVKKGEGAGGYNEGPEYDGSGPS